jgi:hypothetical protein
MNLAQLIDLERVRGKDPLARRPAPAAPLGVVTHADGVTRAMVAAAVQPEVPLLSMRSSKGVTEAVRQYLGSIQTPFVSLDVVAVALRGQFDRSMVNSTLISLHDRGDLNRNGPPGARHYGLSEKGREKLKGPAE